MNTKTASPKSVLFDGQSYTTRSLIRQATIDILDHPYEDHDATAIATGALIKLAVRRAHGRDAWEHTSRRDSWTEDGTSTRYEITVGRGKPMDGHTSITRLWVNLHSDEIAAAAAVLTEAGVL